MRKICVLFFLNGLLNDLIQTSLLYINTNGLDRSLRNIHVFMALQSNGSMNGVYQQDLWPVHTQWDPEPVKSGLVKQY